ncbi:MAG: DUF3017 domain-containing protein [Actinomycetota bacterium]
MTPARFGAHFGALWLIVVALFAGLGMIGLGYVRLGGFTIAGAVFGAALIRLALPSSRAGGLVVRSRPGDVLFLLGMAAALFVIVITLDLSPRG